MEWKSKPWEALTRDEWHGMVRLRIDVFVVEQDCPYPDLDGKDLRAWHVWGEEESVNKGAAAHRGSVIIVTHTVFQPSWC